MIPENRSTEIRYPSSRQLTFDVGKIGRGKRHVQGLMHTFGLIRPQQMQKMMGTVMITTAGMIEHTKGWIVPFGMHPLCLALGTLNEQPAVYKGEIQKREILHLTVLIDHDVIDGAPAARFVDDLVKKMEKGYGL